MDEKVIQQLLNEEVPEWDYEELKYPKDKKITNLNGDNLSTFTDGDEENESCKMNSLSNFGGKTMSSANDIISVVSSTGTNFLSPALKRKYYMSSSGTEDDNSYNMILPHRTGKIIKHAILTKVANQISSSRSKANTGYPVCCARGKYLAVGTSKGVTFLFDLKQVMKFCVGMDDESATFGSVSSLSFNLSSTRLLVGFVKAHIKMWDVSGNEGKLLRSIDVNQGPGYAVSFVRFLPDPTMAVYADTNGSVFQLIFKRGIGGRSTDLECFFSGSRGEILCLESLFIPKHMKRHELEEYSLLAMASFTKVIIVSCKPQLKVKYMHPLKGKPDTLPQLEWSYNTRITESPDVVNNRDVFLTFARNMDVYILKISPQNKSILDLSGENNNSDLKFELVFHWVLEVQILSIKWMNSYFVGVIDFEERFHAIDVQTKCIVESLDMKSAQIIYNTSLFKSIATGGNVSEAMSIAAERACYHSVIDQNGQIKILGQQEIHILMLRPWKEAIEVVHKNQGPEEAFKMCSELYKGNNLVCRQVLLLPNRIEERQRAVTKVAINLIESILSSTLTVFTDFHSLFNAMLDLCVTIKQLSFFTNNIYGKLTNDTEMEIAFIRSILPLILNSTINILHPELVQKIVEYLQNTQQFVQLDCCITKLKISCIDLDQIIKLSSKHYLFSSFIHIYNTAFTDFLTPIKKMIDFISGSEFSRCDREIQSETVIKAIVYIHCCFSGKNFFSGNCLPSSISEEVKSNMFEYLVPFEKGSESTSLNVLLEYNTNEFLNMITLAFDEPFFTSDIGISRKQAVLQKLCAHFTSNKISSFKQEIIRFFVFLSRELNKTSNISVYIDQIVLDELIERVCLSINDYNIILDKQSTVPATSFLQKQAETAFLNFLKSNSSYREHWLKNERILTLSRKAQFYRVCEYIYRSKKMLHMVLECFLLDPDYRIEAFDLIESAWNDDNVDDNQRSQMMEKCFQLSEHLIMANSTFAVIVLITVCNKRVDEVIRQLELSQLESDLRKKNTFSFLRSFFQIRNEINENREICAENQITVSNQISNTIKAVKVPFHVAELFIDLLCKFERDTLQNFLKYSVDYHNDAAIAIISKYNLPYSLGFLYEKTKKFDLASNLYIKVFDDLWERCIDDSELKLENCVISSSIGKSFQICIERFVHLIKKYKSHSSDIEVFWSSMLNSILQKQVNFKKQPYESMIEVIFTYFIKFLSNEIPMSTIMVTILKNPVFTGENFGKIRELMLSMMNSFNYEEILLESCISLMDKDVSNCVLQLKSMMGSGIIVYDPHCSSCLKNLIHFQIDDVDNNIISFRCGHRFHSDCLKVQKSVENQLDIKEEYFCPKCTANLPRDKSSDMRFLKEIINLNKKSEKSKSIGAHNGTVNAINNRSIDLISSEDSSIASTATLHCSNEDFNFSKSQKMIDIPIKLKLAPPNYLLNFCTFE